MGGVGWARLVGVWVSGWMWCEERDVVVAVRQCAASIVYTYTYVFHQHSHSLSHARLVSMRK